MFYGLITLIENTKHFACCIFHTGMSLVTHRLLPSLPSNKNPLGMITTQFNNSLEIEIVLCLGLLQTICYLQDHQKDIGCHWFSIWWIVGLIPQSQYMNLVPC